MTNTKLFELVSKEYIGSKEIKMIVGCGINKAQQIRKEIAQECEEKNILLFTNKIPTEMLLKKIGISIKKIHDKAKMEKELRGNNMKRKLNRKGKLLIIFINILLIMSVYAILDTNTKRTNEIRTNTQVKTKVSENIVKSEIKDKSQVCGLSTIQCEEDNETDLVKEISSRYEVDWKLIESIVIHETANRTSLAYKNRNNVGGLMGSDGLMRFDTIEESYEFMIRAIKVYYLEKGLTTIEQIQKKYEIGRAHV